MTKCLCNKEMKLKDNCKCVVCGKTWYSVECAFHKEEDKDFYECVCSKKCGKKGLSKEDYE